ncbi:hypothetical protein [Erwinia phage FBB1]|nr:hypothetical protein [Erwinia phage FBB1]
MEMQSTQYAIYNSLTKQLAVFDYEEGVWGFTSSIVNAYCTETKSTAEFWLEMSKYDEVLKNCVVVKIVSTINLEY